MKNHNTTNRYDLIVETITPKLAIATGYDPKTWDTYTALVEIDKEGIIGETLWEERHGFRFIGESEAHKQFLMELVQDNGLKQTA